MTRQPPRSNHPAAPTSQNRQSLTVSEPGAGSLTLRGRPRNVDKLSQSYRIKRRGASAVEFAMVAPVFFLLVFGMIEYGRMVMVQQVITNATREGARRAVLDGATATEVRTVVQDYLAASSITATDQDITITPTNPNDAAFGDPVSVGVQVPFSEVSWLPTPLFLGDAQLTASSVMRRERVE